ncbi:cation/calcium exchanger 1-like [Iris pallida]|uniref:Cation/calcium exchanger 1-like n=1 Tax=Iris pallida TaxID=29817 RepID=A0AAX6E8N5_IRIPA|nr:cation/calcium exchanger 1-like [Iris pallida]KAJ6800345.1 cation/calcium exchanger 1-like [Iris pallida]
MPSVDVRHRHEEDVGQVEAGEGHGGPDVDRPEGQDREEDEEDEEEEEDVPHEARPVHGHLPGGDADAHDPDHDGRHEERAAQDAVEPDQARGGAGAREGYDAREDVGRAVAEGEEGHAGDRRVEVQEPRETGEVGAEVVGGRVAEEVEEQDQPEEEAEVAQGRIAAEDAVEEAEVVDVAFRTALVGLEDQIGALCFGRCTSAQAVAAPVDAVGSGERTS